jgi:hypothetical protein
MVPGAAKLLETRHNVVVDTYKPLKNKSYLKTKY